MGFLQLPLFRHIFTSKRSPEVQNATQFKGDKQTTSDRQLAIIWYRLRETYFPDNPNLAQYKIIWSKRRQKRTLASCCLSRKRVTVAKELNYPIHTVWLEPLLYHEMCHAVLSCFPNDLKRKGTRRSWHGPDFKALERKHPLMIPFNNWIKSGGWHSAIRSDRAKNAHKKRIANGH